MLRPLFTPDFTPELAKGYGILTDDEVHYLEVNDHWKNVQVWITSSFSMDLAMEHLPERFRISINWRLLRPTASERFNWVDCAGARLFHLRRCALSLPPFRHTSPSLSFMPRMPAMPWTSW